ncbi:MAG TPA: alcohol dehydrogenase family protein [Cyclobacteriaceae bacterium]|nr:alcohol dehydrogenase family protein [Cyclobacteriaceae bacterium]
MEKISYETIPDPEILDPADAIVRVKQCAICGSDLHVFYGREQGIDHHTAMGHEFTGEVVEVGRDVRNLRKGDQVMSPFTTSCGKCFYCVRGLTCRCVNSQLFGWVENGRGLHGGQSEFVRVPMADGTLVKIPEGVTTDEALLLGDILSTGFFSAKQAGIKSGETHVVIGCGPVGLMAVIGAVHYGSEKLFAVDTVPERLAMAKRFGATPIDATKDNAVEKIREATEGRGADAVMEAVGSGGAGRLAYDLLRPGGTISVVGVCNDEHMSFSPVQAYNKNITYRVGRCPARSMMDELVPFVQKKKHDITSIITHRMKLSEGVHGYDIFANKKDKCLKVVLEP